MSYIQGKDRHQITMSCLDYMVDSEHIVRIVDSFLSAIDLTELGFAPDKATKELYQLRQQTVEPVFGTIKASMGFTSFLLRGLDKVRAEAALVFLGYNIKRSLGALGFQQMIEALGHYGAWLARTGAKRAGAAASSTSACPVQTLQGRRVAFLRPYGQKTRHLRAA